MGLVGDLTPAYYRLVRVGVQREGVDVVAIADVVILNEAGTVLCMHNPSTALTTQEKQVLNGFVTREMAAFEAATGLEEWIDDD